MTEESSLQRLPEFVTLDDGRMTVAAEHLPLLRAMGWESFDKIMTLARFSRAQDGSARSSGGWRRGRRGLFETLRAELSFSGAALVAAVGLAVGSG
jgi:hypothetical protein